MKKVRIYLVIFSTISISAGLVATFLPIRYALKALGGVAVLMGLAILLVAMFFDGGIGGEK